MFKSPTLTKAEIDFLRASYKNHTAKELTLSLNKIRQRLGEKILLTRYVAEFISRLMGGEVINEVDGEVDSLQAPPVASETPIIKVLDKVPRKRAPSKRPDDKKTKALKDYQSETQSDELCVPLEVLLELSLEESETLPGNSQSEVH